MLAKLSEALFVDTLRRYVTGLPDQTTGWLAGARDPVVGKSLALLHSRAHHPLDDRRARLGSRCIPLCAGGAFYALPVRFAHGVLDRMAIASRGPGVDLNPEGGSRYRGRRWLRV